MDSPYMPDEAADYRRENLEDAERARLFRLRTSPDAAEACEECGGGGNVFRNAGGLLDPSWNRIECPRCLGTGVQP